MDQVEKFRGCLIGLAVGDALGAPLQGLKSGRIKDVFGQVRGYIDAGQAFMNKPFRFRSPGVYTDNTQQALCLAESLVRCRGYSAGDFARILLRLWQADPELKTGAFRGVGQNFRKVMDRLASGADPEKAGEPDAGINAASRAAPAGLYFRDDRAELADAAIRQALITHKDPRALCLAATVAYAAARSVSAWDGLKLRDRVDDLIDFAAFAEKLAKDEYLVYLPPMLFDFFGLFLRSIDPLRHWQGMEQELVLRQAVNLANQAFPREKIQSPGQDFALAAGVVSLYLAVVAKDFESGVLGAVNLGREADGMGAIVGAILGARFGEQAIPGGWLSGLKNREQVKARADALFQKDISGLKMKPLKELELDLTRLENQEREKFTQKMIKQGEYDPEAAARKQEARRRAEELARRALMPRRKSKKNKRRREKAPWRSWQD